MTLSWTESLKYACFATLRRRGNVVRQSDFQLQLHSWASNSSSAYRDYAPLKRASFMEPYWFASNPSAARRVFRARTRLGWGNEYDLRRADSRAKLLRVGRKVSVQVAADASVHLPSSKSSGMKPAPSSPSSYLRVRTSALPRIPEPFKRACYLCPADSWMPETIEHLFLFCPHHRLSQLRSDVRSHLATIAAELNNCAPPGCPAAPNLADDAALYAVLQLCTSVGHLSHASPVSVDAPSSPRPVTRSMTASASSLNTSIDWRRQHHQLPLPLSSMQSATSWVAFLTGAWRSSVSSGHSDEVSRLGSRLVDLICSHNQKVFSARRMLLSDDVGYLSRSRDRPGLRKPPCPSSRARPTRRIRRRHRPVRRAASSRRHHHRRQIVRR